MNRVQLYVTRWDTALSADGMRPARNRQHNRWREAGQPMFPGFRASGGHRARMILALPAKPARSGDSALCLVYSNRGRCADAVSVVHVGS